jgi:hypothetical protein
MDCQVDVQYLQFLSGAFTGHAITAYSVVLELRTL